MSDSGTTSQDKAALYRPLYSANPSDYRRLGLVGQGQFAQVYCAIHRRSGRLVAIKQIRHYRAKAFSEGQLESQPGSRLEQIQEATLLQQLNHPNVLKCHAASEQRLILDYCELGNLRSHLSTAFSPQFTPRHLPFSVAKHLIKDILQGLSHLHQHGIIHSDLKPENILLTMPAPNRLTAKLSDLGCAHSANRSNQSKTDIGSPYYAAPERFDGYSSVASDLYSVGVMIYELLVGDRPFIGTHHQLQQSHKSQSPHFPNTLPAAIQQLLSTALHKQPGSRFASALEMLNAFKVIEFAATEPQATDFSSAQASSKDSVSITESQTFDLATTDFSHKAKPISAHGITSPVESITMRPQGCCIVTEKSLHVLTPKRKLMSIARFKQPCWISVSPNGKWFVALPKRNNKRKAKGMIGQLSHLSGHQWRRNITLTGKLLITLLSDVVKVIAIDSRYFLRLRSAPDSSRTYLECFTRRGQFIGELRFNQSITQVIPTATPYQLVASGDDSAVLLINLKPFQIRTVRLPFVPQRIHALAWGYLIVGEQTTVLIDRDAQPITLLKGLPKAKAIASLDNHHLLLANHMIQPSLSVIDATTLNLGMIF